MTPEHFQLARDVATVVAAAAVLSFALGAIDKWLTRPPYRSPPDYTDTQ